MLIASLKKANEKCLCKPKWSYTLLILSTIVAGETFLSYLTEEMLSSAYI